MKVEAREMYVFPVLIGDEVAHFHNISGGYNRERLLDVVNLIHRVQGPGSPDRIGFDNRIEAHLDDKYYQLQVQATRTIDEYPDRDYILSILVNDHRFGPHSFSEPLTADIDKRETRYDGNND